MLRALHYTTSLTRSAGGVYGAVSGLARALSSDADVTASGGADEYFTEDKSAWTGVKLLPHPFGGTFGWHAGVFGIIARVKPDILHIHGIWSAASLYGVVNALQGTHVVVSPHGMLDPWILSRRRTVKKIHAALFERPLLSRAHLHALNESERQSALAFMPSLHNRSFVLPNGIDYDPAPPSTAPRSGTLYLSRVHQKKQTLELIAAWSGLPSDQKLTIAGWGDPAYEERVSQAAGATTNVSFVGSLYGAAKTEAFEASRFFVLPSLSEGLPMAVLEAMQHGCIPVITEACNLPELFTDNVAPRMKTDFSDFTALMVKAVLMSDHELALRSQCARDYAKRYLWSEIAKKLIVKYEAVLSGKSVSQ